MQRPRILLVLTEFPPRIGGMQTHAVNLVQHLAASGYKIEVVTYQPGDASEQSAIASIDSKLPCPVHRCLSRVAHIRNLDILATSARRFRPDLIYTSTIFYGGIWLSVPTIARSVGNDVMRPWIAYPFRFGSCVAGHPILEQPIYRAFNYFDYPESIEIFFRKTRRRIMMESAHSYSRILANSQFTHNLLTEIGVTDNKLDIVVGGVDFQRFAKITPQRSLRAKWSIPADRYLIATVCRLVPKKGIDFLIESMSELIRNFPDIHLLVAGAGRKQRHLLQSAQQSPARQCITFVGAIPHDKIEEVYSAADAFVLASRVHVDPISGLRDAETMGRVLCEANAAGLPVVAANSGGIPSVVQHERNGLLFEPDDIDSLSEQLHRLRAEDNLRRRITQTGRQLAHDEFDWSVVVGRHEKTFAESLAR